MKKDDKNKEETVPKSDLNDLIGHFGPYQLNIMLFSFLREGTLAIDGVALSLTLPSEINFQCVSPFISHENEERCIYSNKNGSATLPCQKWKFPDKDMEGTLTVEYNLVCDLKILGSLLMASYFLGMMFGNIFWGYFADRFGRWKSHTLCHIMALIFSAASLVSPSINLLILSRFAAAFSSVGYRVLSTIQVEMISTKYRTFATTPNTLGWGSGVMSLAFIGLATNNWRYLAAINPFMLLVSLPWLLILPESIRWLKVNGRYEEARKEIKRAAKFNFIKHKSSDDFNSQIDAYLMCDGQQESSKNRNDQTSMLDLFKRPVFCLNLVTLWLASLFNIYINYSRTMHFSTNKRSMFANFVASGISETLCLVISVGSMLIFKRTTCLAFYTFITGLTCFLDSILRATTDIYIEYFTLGVFVDGLAKLSCLTANVVLFLVAFEVFPTELRNRGASIIMTALSIGGMIAPFCPIITQLIGGQLNYGILLVSISILLAICLASLVTETKNLDVADTMEESKKQKNNNNGLS